MLGLLCFLLRCSTPSTFHLSFEFIIPSCNVKWEMEELMLLPPSLLPSHFWPLFCKILGIVTCLSKLSSIIPFFQGQLCVHKRMLISSAPCINDKFFGNTCIIFFKHPLICWQNFCNLAQQCDNVLLLQLCSHVDITSYPDFYRNSSNQCSYPQIIANFIFKCSRNWF